MRFSSVPAILAMMLGVAITGAAADCLSSNGNEYPFGTYTCDFGNEIVSFGFASHTITEAYSNNCYRYNVPRQAPGP